MQRSLRQLDPSRHWTAAATLDALGQTLSRAQIEAVLTGLGKSEQRARKLTLVLVVLVIVAMNLFTEEAIEDVLARLLRGPRFLCLEEDRVPAGASAISQRRQQVGVAPLVALFHQVCRPLATPATRDAFLGGLRLMAIDGVTEDVADTPANARYFGRRNRKGAGRGISAFPQVQGVYLCECGTHAIVDAGFWPAAVPERTGAMRLLRAVGPGMLVMWDSGLHSFDMCAQCVTHRHAHFLGRLPAFVKPELVERLADGSYLAALRPGTKARRRAGETLRVRILEYTLDDPGRVGHGQRHRLVTSLLDAETFPAPQLAAAYHERWEVELTIDETDTHQRRPRQPLRSHTPTGVLQELYGLLLAHYAVRAVMHQAALQAGVAPDRLSFSSALRILRVGVFELQIVAREQRDALYARLLGDIARAQLPARATCRCNPRVVKRKMSNFPLKRETHRRAPQPTKPFADAIVILRA